MADKGVKVRMRFGEREEAQEARALFKDVGARRVKARDIGGARGVGDFPAYVVVGVMGLTALTDLYERCRRNRMCREYIYVREGVLSVERDCSVRDGRIIVIWPIENQRVEIHEVPPGIDITRIAEAVVTSGADAVKAIAEAGGARVEGPRRDLGRDADDDR
jgi:hypothetical protein